MHLVEALLPFGGVVRPRGCERAEQRLLECYHLKTGVLYAAAGKIVNKFFLKFYALGFVFFLVGGIITLVYAKHVVSQGMQGLDQLKGLMGQ